MSGTVTVLFLAADPLGSRADMRLRLDEEAREIRRSIRLGSERDKLAFITEEAVRIRDLQDVLLLHRPQVVHFSGHGDGARGIILEDDAGRPAPVSKEGLAALFEALGGFVRVVVLNACDSLHTIEAFSACVDYCIGMSRPVSDRGAIQFSVAFYGALAFGTPVWRAFDLGLARLRLEASSDAGIPRILVRDGADRRPITPTPRTNRDRDEEAHYLRTLVSRLDTLDLYGLGGRGDGSGAPRMRVSELFTQPVLTLRRTAGQMVADALRAASVAAPGEDGPGKRPQVLAVDAFAGVERLVVLGDPGGGKSMLVNHVAVQLALRRTGETRTFIPGWSEDKRPLPVVVLLREMAAWVATMADEGSGPGRAGWVWDYLTHQLEGCGCAGALVAVGAAIREGAAVVFFDGLDEVAETPEQPWRTRISRAIREFAAPLQGHVLVTCRKYAYAPGDAWRLPDAEFPVVELDRFTLAQIEPFAMQWYLSVGTQNGWSTEESRSRGRQLYEQIKASPQLRDLAGSPLLLTLMARIHRDDQALPDDRARLYDRAIDLLLAEWENRKDEEWRGKDPDTISRLSVPTARLRAALAGLAWDVHTAALQPESRVEGTASVAEGQLLLCLETVAGIAKVREFIEYIRTRAGLLVLRADRTYAFPHRTFQEYLAATHALAREDFAEVLLGHLCRDFAWWREVFFLAAAILARDPERLSVLADAVLVELEDAPHGEVLIQAAASIALAMAAGEFSTMVGRIKRRARLASRMRDILAGAMVDEARLSAPIRAAAAFALSRLGDPREEVRSPEAMPFHPVPAGAFWMGTPADDPLAYPEEVPLHRCEVVYEYWIARFPVTVAQFRAFASAAGYPQAATGPGIADGQPVAVSWHDARALCRWLTCHLRAHASRVLERNSPSGAELVMWTGVAEGRLVASLPSEPEWEKAARGVDAHPRFPWGDTGDPGRANYHDSGIDGASVVGCFPSGVSPLGVEEMSGSMWEWTRSLWGTEAKVPTFGYPYNPTDGRENLDAASDVRRVLRGGAFHSPERSIRSASRFSLPPNMVSPNCGFRVVVVPHSALAADATAPDAVALGGTM